MYGNDFDSSTDTWDLASVGAYVRLLNHQWDKGAIPDDERKVGAILRVGPTGARRLWWIVTDKFPVDGDGMRRNPRMSEIRGEREHYISEQGRKGRVGAAARWNGRGDSHGHSTGHPSAIENGRFLDGRDHGRKDGSSSSSPSPSLPPTPPPPPEGARAYTGLGTYPSAELAEAAFKVFLSKYPPEGVPSEYAAQHAWAEMLPALPALSVLLAALDGAKRSDQWQRGKVHSIVRFLKERMWTGKLGEASTETGRYRVIGD